ncbi:MAG: methyltransferase domain-containing protein [Opitutaceae bacterium]
MMTPDEHRRMAACEDTLWHYAALHGHVRRALARSGARIDGAWLDAGCGTGGLLRRLRRWFPAATLRGIEFSAFAVALARERTNGAVDEGSLLALPYADASFDVVTCVDVVYQFEEPAAAYREAARCLRPGGVLVVNEPAHRWLYSYHDVSVGGRWRFTRAELRDLLRAAGLEPVYATHWNFLPLPLVWARRKFLPAPQGSDVGEYPWWVAGPMRVLMALERAWLAGGGRFPCGVSVLMAARRPTDRG